jgi:putative protein-disulfide isomerase
METTDSLEDYMMGFQPGLYWIIDPLCGWSYGALPLLNRVAQDFTQQHILPGGLFIGTQRRKLDADWLSHVHEHDARIAALTGMTFGSDYRTQLLTNSEIMLDSLPASRGLLAAQRFAAPGSDLLFLNASSAPGMNMGRTLPAPMWSTMCSANPLSQASGWGKSRKMKRWMPFNMGEC